MSNGTSQLWKPQMTQGSNQSFHVTFQQWHLVGRLQKTNQVLLFLGPKRSKQLQYESG